MKSVTLIRHVKSDWSNVLQDFDRPVRDDRKKDVLAVAKEIEKKGEQPQFIISSPAKRTLQTARLLCKRWDHPFKDVAQEKSLYECNAHDILAVINKVDDNYESIAIVCHNPAITDFTRQYSDAYIDNIPTTGAVRIEFDVKHWKEIKDKGELKWFLQPKEL